MRRFASKQHALCLEALLSVCFARQKEGRPDACFLTFSVSSYPCTTHCTKIQGYSTTFFYSNTTVLLCCMDDFICIAGSIWHVRQWFCCLVAVTGSRTNDIMKVSATSNGPRSGCMDVLEFPYSGVYPNERESLHNPSLPHCAEFCFRKARPRSVPQYRKQAAKFLLENSQKKHGPS